MHTYFFHVHARTRERDHDGVCLLDADAAALEATRFAGELLAHEPHQLLDNREVRIEVTDGERPLYAIRMMVEPLPCSGLANGD